MFYITRRSIKTISHSSRKNYLEQEGHDQSLQRQHQQWTCSLELRYPCLLLWIVLRLGFFPDGRNPPKPRRDECYPCFLSIRQWQLSATVMSHPHASHLHMYV